MLSLTDAQIGQLLQAAKQVISMPKSRKVKGSHEEADFELASKVPEERFVVYARQNTLISDDYSCGIRWKTPSGEEVTLLRCNGSSHAHKNPIEGTEFRSVTHVHTATERYIQANKRPEHFAVQTAAYTDLKGALAELSKLCNVSGGLNLPPKQSTMFNAQTPTNS